MEIKEETIRDWGNGGRVTEVVVDRGSTVLRTLYEKIFPRF
jgi:hypothetical protein